MKPLELTTCNFVSKLLNVNLQSFILFFIIFYFQMLLICKEEKPHTVYCKTLNERFPSICILYLYQDVGYCELNFSLEKITDNRFQNVLVVAIVRVTICTLKCRLEDINILSCICVLINSLKHLTFQVSASIRSITVDAKCF